MASCLRAWGQVKFAEPTLDEMVDNFLAFPGGVLASTNDMPDVEATLNGSEKEALLSYVKEATADLDNAFLALW